MKNSLLKVPMLCESEKEKVYVKICTTAPQATMMLYTKVIFCCSIIAHMNVVHKQVFNIPVPM